MFSLIHVIIVFVSHSINLPLLRNYRAIQCYVILKVPALSLQWGRCYGGTMFDQYNWMFFIWHPIASQSGSMGLSREVYKHCSSTWFYYVA